MSEIQSRMSRPTLFFPLAGQHERVLREARYAFDDSRTARRAARSLGYATFLKCASLGIHGAEAAREGYSGLPSSISSACANGV